MNSYYSNILNATRWLAAFFVVIAHARHLTFVAYKDVEDRSIWIKGFYFLTGLGHEAVLVFFVISGLLVGGLTMRRTVGRFDLRSYILSRVSRIYAVLIFALIINWVADYVGLTYFNASELYTNSAKYATTSMEFVVGSRLDLFTLLGNLFCVQTFVTSPLGSNGPLWSLAYEWWYYVIFGAVALVWYSSSGWERIGGSTLLVAAAYFLPAALLLWGLIWALGIAVYIYCESSLPKPPKWAGAIVFLFATVATRLSHSSEAAVTNDPLLMRFFADFWFAASFAFFLSSFYGRSGKVKFYRFNEIMASFSFSTYLIHFPLYVLIVAISYQFASKGISHQPGFSGFSFMVCSLLLLYVLTYGFSLLTEKHTASFKEFLSRHLSAISSPRAAGSN